MRRWIVPALVITVLLVSGFAIIYLQRRAGIIDRRHQIFCEKLVKGMNKQEVLRALNEFGEFEYGKSDWGESYSEIFGNYTDTSIIGRSTVYIMFAHNEYTNVYIKKFASDQGETICGP